MKQLTRYKTIFSLIILTVVAPALCMAQPPNPGGGDPFAAPVNGGVAFVAGIAFLYGAYRLYQSTKKDRAKNTNR